MSSAGRLPIIANPTVSAEQIIDAEIAGRKERGELVPLYAIGSRQQESPGSVIGAWVPAKERFAIVAERLINGYWAARTFEIVHADGAPFPVEWRKYPEEMQ